MNGANGRAGADREGRERRGKRAAGRLLFFAFCGACLLSIFASSALGAPPTIEGTKVSEVTTSSATLNASVNPNGQTTKYHFEYGLEDCEASACTKAPTEEAGSGSSPVPASAHLEGLSPGTTYHYRLVANGLGGITKGPDRTFTTYRLPQVFKACANEGFRANKPSAALPDCRAYEQASPVQKNAVDARGIVGFVKASINGDRVSFSPAGGMPGAEGSQELPVYLSSRGDTNWSTQGVLPPASAGQEAFVMGWNADFSRVFDAARHFDHSGGGTFLSRPSDGSPLETIVPYGGGLGTLAPSYAGSSADGAEVLFESTSALDATPAAIEGKPNLYLWDRESGEISLAGVLNDETAPTQGALAGPFDWAKGISAETLRKGGAGAADPEVPYYTQDEHVISADGSRVYFTAAGTGQVYLRENPTQPQSPLDGQGDCTVPALACTINISASRRTPPDPVGTRPAVFMEASPDGSVAFLASSEKLTDDANTGPERPGPSIARAGIAGTGKELGFLAATRAKGLAIGGEFLYWADPEDGTIGRAKLNGAGAATEANPTYILTGGKPQYVAVDDEFIYWTDAEHEGKEEGKIGRVELDGDNLEPEFIVRKESPEVKGPTNPQGIAVDDEYIYWANAGEEYKTMAIGRAKLQGEEVNEEFIHAGSELIPKTPQGVAVDSAHIYVTAVRDPNTFVERYDLNGGSHIQIDGGMLSAPRGIALDSGHVYWARQGKDAIGRANLELGSPELEFIKEAGAPLGIAVDGEHVYWSANQETPPNPGNDLYRYDAEADTLEDVAPAPGVEDGARVVGVLGSSADGSTVYFAANGDLDEAGPAQEGDCKGGVSGTFVNFSGQCNLYVVEGEGAPQLITPLDATGGPESDAYNWVPEGNLSFGQKTARVTADGQTLLFRSQSQLTDYDNEGTPELYRYRAGEGIGCVSCDPSGEGPTGIAGFGSITLSAIVPVESSYLLSRNLSADGSRVFFETTDSLVGEDTNGEADCPSIGPEQGKYRVCLDAYEWEAEGTGSCEEDVIGGGCLYLLSTGKSQDASYIADASASGEDVFLITRSALVGQDEDQLFDVYDARLGGGLAAQYPTHESCASAEACHEPPPPPPSFQSPGSASFQGPPNPKPHKKKRHHKKKHHKKHHGKRHAHKGHGRAARTSGRAGR